MQYSIFNHQKLQEHYIFSGFKMIHISVVVWKASTAFVSPPPNRLSVYRFSPRNLLWILHEIRTLHWTRGELLWRSRLMFNKKESWYLTFNHMLKEQCWQKRPFYRNCIWLAWTCLVSVLFGVSICLSVCLHNDGVDRYTTCVCVRQWDTVVNEMSLCQTVAILIAPYLLYRKEYPADGADFTFTVPTLGTAY